MSKNFRNYNITSTKMSGFAILGVIALLVVSLFVVPWLYFWLAYFSGWIAKLVIGKYLVEGFGLFGLAIPLDKIPLAAGILGWVGSFFKETVKINQNKSN